jgi:hopanoid biosynthesis associated protein HpnK
LIITADDFGLAAEVNDAVEIGHRDGVLSAASLMVAAPAAPDAVQRAKNLPRLRVGLHLALTDARPALPPRQIPGLVDGAGRLRSDLGRFGLDLALYASLRRQLAAEIAAQFLAFEATGLQLDHVNVHQHFHLHPAVASIVLAVGRRFGMTALRVPYEPRGVLARAEPASASGELAVERLCAGLLRRRALRARLTIPEGVLGRRWSGALSPERLLALIEHTPPGIWEIYLHPATSNEFAGHAPGYRYADEFAALTAPACREALIRTGHNVGGYSDL